VPDAPEEKAPTTDEVDPARSTSQPANPRHQRSQTLRLGLIGVAFILGAWLLVVGVTLVRAAGDLQAGRHAADRAHGLKLSDLATERPLTDLTRAARRLGDVHRELDSAVVAPLRLVPVAGRQLRSASALSGAASLVAETGVVAVSQGPQMLQEPHGAGPARVRLLGRLGGLVQRTEQRLAAVDLGPDHGLISPLARARDQLALKLTSLRTGLAQGAAGVRAVAQLLAGPRRYLVLAANNSEMRAGSGMFLSVGALQAGNGRLQLSAVRSVTQAPVPPGAVPLGGDLAARWGWLQPNVDWRNLMVSPRFDVAAPLAARMWAASGNGPVDGVLALDPVAMKGILAATGPVQVAGRTIGSDDVVDELLHEQYIRLPAGAQVSERREELGALASAALQALDGRNWSPERLVQGLSTAARGRHLLAWAARPSEEQAWTRAGVGGAMSGDSLLVAVLNRGGNKLDYRLSSQAKLTLRPGRNTEGTLAITLANHADLGDPPYIIGPDPSTGLHPGDYLGFLAVTLPGQATQGRIDGSPPLAVAGPDGPTRVIGTEVLLPAGQSRTLVIHFLLPGRHGSLRLEPSARVPALRGWPRARSCPMDAPTRCRGSPLGD